MKKNTQNSNTTTLPSDEQTCEMILRLDRPHHCLAWLMMETGLRYVDLATMPVSSFSRDKQVVSILVKGQQRKIALSTGLAEAMADYVAVLRPGFERKSRRSRTEGIRFSGSLLFPLWAVTSYRSAAPEISIPAMVFVDALQEAARASGFNGTVQSHTLRHVCANRWLRQGMEITEVHARLGHRDMLTTMMLAQALHFGGLTFTTALAA